MNDPGSLRIGSQADSDACIVLGRRQVAGAERRWTADVEYEPLALPDGGLFVPFLREHEGVGGQGTTSWIVDAARAESGYRPSRRYQGYDCTYSHVIPRLSLPRGLARTGATAMVLVDGPGQLILGPPSGLDRAAHGVADCYTSWYRFDGELPRGNEIAYREGPRKVFLLQEARGILVCRTRTDGSGTQRVSTFVIMVSARLLENNIRVELNGHRLDLEQPAWPILHPCWRQVAGGIGWLRAYELAQAGFAQYCDIDQVTARYAPSEEESGPTIDWPDAATQADFEAAVWREAGANGADWQRALDLVHEAWQLVTVIQLLGEMAAPSKRTLNKRGRTMIDTYVRSPEGISSSKDLVSALWQEVVSSCILHLQENG